MQLSSLTAISPIDGRYHEKTKALSEVFSEYALMRQRLIVEIHWLIALSIQKDIAEIPPLSEHDETYLMSIIDQFNESTAQKVKSIEATTNHDVKAIEYYLKEQMSQSPTLQKYLEFVHFACTSEDINNLAYALMLREARSQYLVPIQKDILNQLIHFSHQFANQPMLSRTHGQAASPTTVGKEFANFAARLQKQLHHFENIPILGKFNGAVGNFNAHVVSYPHVDWQNVSQSFIESLGIFPHMYTTQIEPHDWIAEYCHALFRMNTILIDCARDIWGYISVDYFQQKKLAHEVGSSTMPHKINPIDFENAEGNLGFANSMLSYFAEKLPLSRWQRDLTDSTLLRNVGVAIAHCYLGYQSLMKGFSKLILNPAKITADLECNWEVLAEAIQTVMRRYGVQGSYEKLKELTRGQKLSAEALKEFIAQLDIPEDEKKRLSSLTPAGYVGYAQGLAGKIHS